MPSSILQRLLPVLAASVIASCGSDPVTPGGDAGFGPPCGDNAGCPATEICVQRTINGGACMIRQGAQCPAGMFDTTCPGGEPGCFSRSTTFTCETRPSQCASITCDCAVPIVCGNACSCARASDEELACICNAP